jgi:hypothetical protein
MVAIVTEPCHSLNEQIPVSAKKVLPVSRVLLGNHMLRIGVTN